MLIGKSLRKKGRTVVSPGKYLFMFYNSSRGHLLFVNHSFDVDYQVVPLESIICLLDKARKQVFPSHFLVVQDKKYSVFRALWDLGFWRLLSHSTSRSTKGCKSILKKKKLVLFPSIYWVYCLLLCHLNNTVCHFSRLSHSSFKN